MDRRFALFAFWALFAAASVGVGFGAAGLVGDPFTDGVSDSTRLVPATPTGSSPPTSTPDGPPTSATPTESPTESPTEPSPTEPSPTTSAATTSRPSATERPPAVTSRSLATRAGLVSATCRGAVVRLAASPAVGWGIEDLDADDRDEARVRFHQVGEDSERVEVRASCIAGTPRFRLDDDARRAGEEGGQEGDEDDSRGDRSYREDSEDAEDAEDSGDAESGDEEDDGGSGEDDGGR